jgi:molybdopterin-guanine dinucleotide biosynthesis protein A
MADAWAAGDTAVVVLAGGEARRFPGKLEHRVDGATMIARVVDNVRASGWPVYIAGKGSFPAGVDERLDTPLLVDRRPGEGPLRALLFACAAIRAERLFAVAADQPRLVAAVLQRLAASRQPGDEAVVPEHDGEIEPLAALYERRAVLREGFELRRAGGRAMRDLIGRLAARFVPLDAAYFHNVNSPADLA